MSWHVIDSRLLHGQVATTRLRQLTQHGLLLFQTTLLKMNYGANLIKQAAPGGIKAHVVPIDQMIKLAKDDQHFGKERALLLFESPQDALRAVEGGVPLETINVGSMAHSTGKVQPEYCFGL